MLLKKVRKSTILFAVLVLFSASLFAISTYGNTAREFQNNTIGNALNVPDSGKNSVFPFAISAYSNAAREFQQNTADNVLNKLTNDGNDRAEDLAVDSSNTVLYFDEHPAFSQKDLNDNFLHYTQGDSRADLPQPDNIEEVANAVGVVLEQDTNRPVSGATIFVDETALVCTGDDGRFQITNLPNGVYNWRIAAADYYDSQYLNYSVHWADGADIFTFYLSDSASIVKERESIY